MVSRKILIFFLLAITQILPAQRKSDADMIEFMKEFNILILSNQKKEAKNLLDQRSTKVSTQDILTQVQINFLYSKYFLNIDDFDSGKKFAHKAYQIGQSTENDLAQAYGLYALCYYYNMLDLTDMSFDYAQQVLSTVDLDQHPFLATQVYYRLYAIHANWDEADEALRYAEKAITYANKAKDFNALSNGYTGKSTASEIKYRQDGDTAYHDSILFYLHKSIALKKQYPEQIDDRTNIISNINMANHFFQELMNHQIPYNMADDSINYYLSDVAHLPNELDQNYQLRASALGMKAQLYVENNDYDKAEDTLRYAYEKLQEEQNSPAYYTLYNITIGLYYLYDLKGDYKQAYDFLKINQVYKDSVYNKEKIREVHSLEAKYENEKIKEELHFLASESRLRKIQNYLLITVCLLILIILYVLRKSYFRKLALQKEKSISLEKKKAEAEAQVKLEQEKQARLSAERKILKLENEKMQKEVIVGNLQIKRKNELLMSFRDKIAKLDGAFEVDKSLKQEQRLEKSLNETIQEFEDINPDFFNKLKNKSNNRLTPLDLKYCAYFHLGLGTKEIAQIFKVEPKSIRMKKYRIKQKLQLPKEQSLEDFFEEIEST